MGGELGIYRDQVPLSVAPRLHWCREFRWVCARLSAQLDSATIDSAERYSNRNLSATQSPPSQRRTPLTLTPGPHNKLGTPGMGFGVTGVSDP